MISEEPPQTQQPVPEQHTAQSASWWSDSLLCCSLCPLPLVLALSITEKSLALFTSSLQVFKDIDKNPQEPSHYSKIIISSVSFIWRAPASFVTNCVDKMDHNVRSVCRKTKENKKTHQHTNIWLVQTQASWRDPVKLYLMLFCMGTKHTRTLLDP